MKQVRMPGPFDRSPSSSDGPRDPGPEVERVRFRDVKVYTRVHDGRLTAPHIVYRTTNPLDERKNPKKKGT